MKKLLFIVAVCLFPFLGTACEGEPDKDTGILPPEQAANPGGEDSENENQGNMESNTLKLSVGGKILTATLVENSSVDALKNLLTKGDLTIEMEDYASMEKVGALGTTLPRNDEYISTVPGDLILYQGRYFVIYYGNNSYSLTRLGKINGITQSELKAVLGNGDVTVTLALGNKE